MLFNTSLCEPRDYILKYKTLHLKTTIHRVLLSIGNSMKMSYLVWKSASIL